MNAPAPKVSRAREFPLIWIVPAVALAIGAWIGIAALRDRGPVITIDFDDGSGVEAGRTELVYRGVSAGTVESVELKPGLGGVTVRLRLRKAAAPLARTGSRFWIVHPEIGFSGIRGLETLVTGIRLSVIPGEGPRADHFTGLSEPPPPQPADPGRTFLLRASQLGSLTTGAPVFYREFKVGEVEASRLADDARAVLVRVHVPAQYAPLVRTSTRFWNAGGLSMKISLFHGAELKNTSLESLLTGGVAFATPDQQPLAPAAADGAQFELADQADKDWLAWAPAIPIESGESAERSRAQNRVLNQLIKP